MWEAVGGDWLTWMPDLGGYAPGIQRSVTALDQFGSLALQTSGDPVRGAGARSGSPNGRQIFGKGLREAIGGVIDCSSVVIELMEATGVSTGRLIVASSVDLPIAYRSKVLA